jgi:hypothetical protein
VGINRLGESHEGGTNGHEQDKAVGRSRATRTSSWR